MDYHVYITFAVAMIAILNPIGNAALFIGMTSSYSAKRQRSTALVCGFAISIIMLLSIWIGQTMLSAFGISVGAFSTAGGLIVLLIGLGMVRAQTHTHEFHDQKKESIENKDSVAVVPLAIPIVAGPGAITAIIAHAYLFTTTDQRIIESLLCIGLAIVIAIVFIIAPVIAKVLGKNGMKIVTRVMGMILCAIAIQMAAQGITSLFNL